MNSFTSVIACLFLVTLACAQEKNPPIRQFDVPTMEALGIRLFQQDEVARIGSTILFRERPEAQNVILDGWISEIEEGAVRLHFFHRPDSTSTDLKHAYVIHMGDTEPRVEDRRSEPVPMHLEAQVAARRSAMQAIRSYFRTPYNFEVVADPDGEGWLVYALAATREPGKMVMTGHKRVTVSADGKTVESVDHLSSSLVITDMPPPSETDKVEPAYVSHMVSSTPVETHLFTALLYQTPLDIVVDRTREHWRAWDGKITKIGKLE